MDVLVSALLLVAFILFVDLTFGEGNHRAAQLAGLFSSGASFEWPAGVQEEDHPWIVGQQVPRQTSESASAAAWPPRQARRRYTPADGRSSPGEWSGPRDAVERHGPRGLVERTMFEDTADAVSVDRVLVGPTRLSGRRR